MASTYIFRGELVFQAQPDDIWSIADDIKAWFDAELSIVGVLRISADEVCLSLMGAQVFTFTGPESCKVVYSATGNGVKSLESVVIRQPLEVKGVTILRGQMERVENDIELRDA